MRRPHFPTSVAAVALSAALLTSCSTESGTAEATTTDAATPRLALSYDGGVLILDAATLDVVGSAEVDGFTRLNPAGDDRHVLISTGNAFTALDTAEPALTDVTFEAKTPGHVVRHDGKTVLFDDGTGLVRVFDPAGLSEGSPATTEFTTPTRRITVSPSSCRTAACSRPSATRTSAPGSSVLDRDRKEIARSEDCPGVHGEAVAADETVVVGCQDGLLVYRDGVDHQGRPARTPTAASATRPGTRSPPSCSATTRPTPTPNSSAPNGSPSPTPPRDTLAPRRPRRQLHVPLARARPAR